MDGVEMMDWIEEYATIREEEYQVKVEFEDPRLWQTMTFKVTPSEKCSSLKVRAAKTIGHFASKLLLFRGSRQMGYSHNVKLYLQSCKQNAILTFLVLGSIFLLSQRVSFHVTLSFQCNFVM